MDTLDVGISSDEMDNRVNRTVATIRRTILIGLCLTGLTAVILTPFVLKAREAARRTNCNCGLKVLGLALHNYHDHFGSFPPAFVRGPDGQPWHSWRVLILPYLDQTPLYNEYDFGEPWDGPNNRKLMARMPQCFVCPSRPRSSKSALATSMSRGILACGGTPEAAREGFTSYAAVLGLNCVFRGVEPVAIEDVSDGTSNTLLVGECSRTRIPWTKPEDIDISIHPKLGDPDGFSSFHKDGCYFLLGDGTVRFVKLSIPQSVIDSLCTRNGGETIDTINEF
ncbi:MAG: DUF1559 domain-containing protein [Planctomycetales bacterium]|nr:DUF1559 domain-containing protein [Planctomycetales bacterium]